MLQKVMKYAGPMKKTTLMSCLVLLGGVLMSVVPFFLASQIITPLFMGNQMSSSYIMIRILGVLCCLILHACLYIQGLVLSHEAAYYTLMQIRISMQKKMEILPLGIIQETGVGTMKKMLVDDVDSIEILLAHALPEGFANSMIPVIVYISMFTVDWKLALMSLASLPFGMAAMAAMYGIGMKEMENYYKTGQIMNQTIVEYINGMEVVKVFNKEGESYRRFQQDVTHYRDFTLAWYKACWPWMALYNSILPCTMVLTLPLGSWFVLQGYSSLPDLILVLCLSLSIGIPLLKAIGFLPSMPQVNYKISALEDILKAEPLRQDNQAFKGRDHSVTFDDVVFAYEEKAVIRNVSLTVLEGTTTALVGASGSGKSTLAKLLVHYYDTDSGAIRIGGQNLCDMSLESLNQQISYLSQEQYLFPVSLLENIRMGKLNAADEEVIEAARRAQCMEFLEKLPDGIHTVAGDGGKQLSGGQRQRIALARAILKNAPIVVLDEATAFTDPDNEEKMEAAIAEAVKDKTLIVIAHRIPSIIHADQICVMDQGRLAARGTHAELLITCEAYQKLWNAAIASARWNVTGGKEEQENV
ncbi:MAG: ABC transporter ATP-binding protein [Lachnospiraceae bacterium]